MYQASYPPPFLVHEEMGTNAPKVHQRVIGKLMTGLGQLYYDKQTLALEPFVETMLDEGKSSPTPDLILCDNEADKTRIIIEVCHTTGLGNDVKKVIWLIEDNDYGILEGFIYNYKTERWQRYRKGDGGLPTESSYSELLLLDLNTFL